MNDWEGPNRRKFPRVIYPCLITLGTDPGDKAVLLTHTENVGAGGICAVVKDNLRLFAPVCVELDLLDLEDHLLCQGKVVWSIRRSSQATEKPLYYEVGIEFVGLSDQDRQRIEKIIARLVRSHRSA